MASPVDAAGTAAFEQSLPAETGLATPAPLRRPVVGEQGSRPQMVVLNDDASSRPAPQFQPPRPASRRAAAGDAATSWP